MAAVCLMQNVWEIWGHQTGSRRTHHTYIHFYSIRKRVFFAWERIVHQIFHARHATSCVTNNGNACALVFHLNCQLLCINLIFKEKKLPGFVSADCWRYSWMSVSRLSHLKKKKNTRVKCKVFALLLPELPLNGNSLSLSLSVVSRLSRCNLNASVFVALNSKSETVTPTSRCVKITMSSY